MKINGVTVDAKKVIHKKAPRFTPAEAKKEATTFNNVIRVPSAGMSNSEDYYIVLDRSALIFREDSLVK